MRARLTNPHVFIQLMSFRQYLREEHFHFRIDFTCSDRRWQRCLLLGLARGYKVLAFHLLAKVSKAKSEIKKNSIFLHHNLLLWLVCHFSYFQNIKFGAKKMKLSRIPHEKSAGDVFTVQHLNTPVVSTVPVDLLPRGMSGRKSNPSSQVLLARFQFEALCEVLSAILSSPSISEEQRGRLQALLFRIIRLIRAFPN